MTVDIDVGYGYELPELTFTRPTEVPLEQVSIRLLDMMTRESRLSNEYFRTLVDYFDQAVSGLENITIADITRVIQPHDFSDVILMRFRRIPNPDTRNEFIRRLYQHLQGRS
jgi:hypothetical protein